MAWAWGEVSITAGRLRGELRSGAALGVAMNRAALERLRGEWREYEPSERTHAMLTGDRPLASHFLALLDALLAPEDPRMTFPMWQVPHQGAPGSIVRWDGREEIDWPMRCRSLPEPFGSWDA